MKLQDTQSLMKAIVWTKYGSPEVLQFKEVEKPVPKDNEVLIKVHATTVTAGDCEGRSLKFPFLMQLAMRVFIGLRKPKRITILGQELSGEVADVGCDVLQYKKGDQVCAATLMRFGAYAEYICLPESYPIITIPENMSYEEAATIPTGGINALHFITVANLQSEDKLLINGSGGSIGTYGLQIAKSYGAEVTCVDSEEKLDMLKSLGADHVIDYKKEDFTRSGKKYDVIVDVVGKSSYSDSVKSLKKNGRLVLGNPNLSGVIRGLWTSLISNKKVIFKLADYNVDDIVFLKELIEAGEIKSVIDKKYSLQDMVEAHRYVEKGLKAGNVVITVTQ